MARKNRIDTSEYKCIAEEMGLEVDEVKRIVYSYFAVFLDEAKVLPYNDRKKIFTKGRFSELGKTRNIPFIGRLGPVYSRYLCWRSNEAKCQDQALRSSYRSRISQNEVENMAAEVFSGKTPSPVRKKKTYELYDRVWMVDKVKKKLARQVIRKED